LRRGENLVTCLLINKNAPVKGRKIIYGARNDAFSSESCVSIDNEGYWGEGVRPVILDPTEGPELGKRRSKKKNKRQSLKGRDRRISFVYRQKKSCGKVDLQTD